MGYVETIRGRALDRSDINRPKHPRKIKLLLTADWQSVPEVPEQVAAERAMMDDIEAHHFDTDYMIFAGDLIDRPTENDTGLPSPRTFKDLFSDMRTRIPSIPLSRTFFIPGDHERDGTGGGLHRWASSYHSYLTDVGPLFYHVDKGNVRVILMGDMAGTVGGEITNYAVDWLAETLKRSTTMNVIFVMHQPLNNSVWTPGSSDPLSAAMQYLPQRIIDVITLYDNIAFGMYGHNGISLEEATTVSTAYGTTWINVQMGIPTAITNGFDLHYALADLVDGSSQIAIKRWNATQHDWLGLNDVTVTTKYPIQLGGDTLEFDGRSQASTAAPVFSGPTTAVQTLSEFRADTSPFAPNPTMQIIHRVVMAKDVSTPAPIGIGVGTGFFGAGGTPVSDLVGRPIVSIPGYSLMGIIGYSRLVDGDQDDYQAQFEAWVTKAKADGGGQEIFMSGRSSSSSVKGLYLHNAGNLYVGDRSTPTGTSTQNQAALMGDGRVITSRSSATPLYLYRRGTDGTIALIHKGATQVGDISVTATATAFNTASDQSLKDDEGELSFEKACDILSLIQVHEFRWKSTGKADIGAFAQELYEVYPTAVTVGGWYSDATGAPWTRKSKRGATYQPWSVDYSKLMPVVVRCSQGVIAEQDRISSRLAALESAP